MALESGNTAVILVLSGGLALFLLFIGYWITGLTRINTAALNTTNSVNAAWVVITRLTGVAAVVFTALVSTSVSIGHLWWDLLSVLQHGVVGLLVLMFGILLLETLFPGGVDVVKTTGPLTTYGRLVAALNIAAAIVAVAVVLM